ncbi:MAG: DegT/DnrJ/EryC1/StrS family aminotransferase [Proteobacteria bacterium]|jgi:dTDP-4-amino-4,6-dideoxygalactose transaminase|nr:DegT/DnrJ/EryC1/StrS family aminotransferase [Pseudomonadota bacterium]
MIPMLDLARLHAPLAAELERAFRETLESGRFIGGPAVERFEEELAAHVGARFAVGTSSGTDALLAALMALGVSPGDEVITTPFSFFATAGCIARLGARPVFADLEPGGFHVDPSRIEERITSRTVGVLPAHLFGACAAAGEIRAISERRGLWLLEDAAQAIGATRDGRAAGTFGAAGALSFFPAKNLGALGDAGAVVTDDPGLAARIRLLREHGAAQRNRHEAKGGNFRLDALQAALLSVKLPHLPRWEEGRRGVARFYSEELRGLGDLVLPAERPGDRHVFNQYVVRTSRRDALAAALEADGIGCALYYPTPLHLQPCFERLGVRPGELENAERACREAIALPIDPLLAEDERAAVVRAVRRAMEKR